ncbi:NAD(P)H-quinone oxidoreductase subunit O, chloroplastic [Rhodamnia argentea]|uniref:NAD(P)H-quinone oxidoreductase subunit O, chloroplastic n=1 Tax=Rhodamnia argentea TaxID=178133 RepID=A0A8B8QBB0_9MYRT|nr:NAD(P)H-quinone oxidoreductase subunit O, chloroplastic [Rhodamnia argentea]
MAFSAVFSHNTFSCVSPPHPQPIPRNHPLLHSPSIRALAVKTKASAAASEQDKEKPAQAKTEDSSNANAQPSTVAPKRPKKPVYSMKKGQIVRVDKEKYLNSINYLSVGHPPYYKGLDYIYEDRGEVLDIRIFETGEYALIAWVGIPTAPAWLPTDMLIKSEKLDYERL